MTYYKYDMLKQKSTVVYLHELCYCTDVDQVVMVMQCDIWPSFTLSAQNTFAEWEQRQLLSQWYSSLDCILGLFILRMHLLPLTALVLAKLTPQILICFFYLMLWYCVYLHRCTLAETGMVNRQLGKIYTRKCFISLKTLELLHLRSKKPIAGWALSKNGWRAPEC